MASKHVPQRTCAGCGRKTGKRELVRIVRAASGDVVMDPTGKLAGRGAYLCSDGACWESALKRRRLEHNLRTPIPTEARAMLLALADQLGTRAPREEVVIENA